MNSIREQLEAEKAAYRGARYSGDLAADVLPRRTSSWWIGAMGGVAAALALALNLYTRPDPVSEGQARHRVVIGANHAALAKESLWTPPNVRMVSMSEVGSMPSPGPMPSAGEMPGFPSLFDSDDGSH
jgi:hypothetical protein